MTDDDVIEILFRDFTDDLRERIKYVKLCHKGDDDGDDDNLLWHFTRFSVLRNMLIGGQLWLSDLAFSNDANEIVFGLNRVPAVLDDLCPQWSNRNHASTVREIAHSAIQRFQSTFHVFAFCLSLGRDTSQHWNGYGGGLNTVPAPDDPHVAVGFDAQSLFYPIELSNEEPESYVMSIANGNDSADHLAQYWAIKARKALEVRDAGRVSLSTERLYDALARMLVLNCALVKNEGWRNEDEYRLLYINEKFGEEHSELPRRPDGRGRYVPVRWFPDRLPIRAVVPHPLADAGTVERSLRSLRGGAAVRLICSELRPRPK